MKGEGNFLSKKVKAVKDEPLRDMFIHICEERKKCLSKVKSVKHFSRQTV